MIISPYCVGFENNVTTKCNKNWNQKRWYHGTHYLRHSTLACVIWTLKFLDNTMVWQWQRIRTAKHRSILKPRIPFLCSTAPELAGMFSIINDNPFVFSLHHFKEQLKFQASITNSSRTNAIAPFHALFNQFIAWLFVCLIVLYSSTKSKLIYLMRFSSFCDHCVVKNAVFSTFTM